MIQNRISICVWVVMCFASAASSHGQVPDNCVKHRRWEKTVFVTQDLIEKRPIEETSYETIKETKYRTEWNREKRERTIIEEKPVTRTSEKVVSKVVPKKVTETKYRTVRRVENSMEEVTEMRDEQYTVPKTVVETVMRDEEYTVSKPITETLYKKEEVTSLKPRTVRQTTLAPGSVVVPPDPSARPRARWLSRGYYTDSVTGQRVWRRPGFHWVDESRYAAGVVPVLVPQETETLAYVPETTMVEKPIEVTRYVDEIKTRKVPVKVERTVEEVRTRKVPYTVKIPKKTIVEEQIPYQETRYVDEIIETVVPVEETVMRKVKRTEPYDFETARWVPYEVERKVPRYTTREVSYTASYRVPYIVKMEQPLDALDRPVGPAREIEGSHKLHPNWKTMMIKVSDAKPVRGETTETSQSVVESGVSNPATFAVGGQSQTDPASGPVGKVRTETLVARGSIGSPPASVEFPAGSERATAKMVDLPKATAETAEKKPQIDPNSPEAIANRQLQQDIRRNFENVGLTIEDVNSPAERATELPTQPAPIVRSVEETSASSVKPQPLEISVDIPPAKRPDEGSAVTDLDDTIEEKDVDVSRPDRP